MPALPRNPSTMTKERLVQELRKHNIPLPRGNSKKGAYVELYQKHLLDRGENAASPRQQEEWTSYRSLSVNTSPKFGFSSDEEDEVVLKTRRTAVVLNANNNRGQRRALNKASRNEFEDRLAEVEGLSDADLRKELQYRGVKPGPIVASTRAVYERKLANLLLQPEQNAEEEEEEAGLSQEEEAMEDEEGDSQDNQDKYSDSDVDDEDNSETQTASRSVSSRSTRTAYSSRVTQLIDQESSSKSRQRSVTPKTKTETVSTERVTKTTSGQRREEKGKPLVPVWLQILIFLLIAAFLIVIWYNMETGQVGSPLVTEV